MSSARPFIICLALLTSLGTSALANCMADPSMSASAQMGCCKAGHHNCPMKGSASDCCKTDTQQQQQVAVAKAELIQSTLTSPALAMVVTAGSLDSVAPAWPICASSYARLRASFTPPYFLVSALLI